jgi:hypothetical protein
MLVGRVFGRAMIVLPARVTIIICRSISHFKGNDILEKLDYIAVSLHLLGVEAQGTVHGLVPTAVTLKAFTLPALRQIHSSILPSLQ